jgi:SnoaL-like domain
MNNLNGNVMKTVSLIVLIAVSTLMGAAGWASGVLTAQDNFEIQQLYARYNLAIDGGDAEGWASTFTADGVFNTFIGHDALVGFVKMWHEKLNGGTRRHWNTNLQITGTRQQATALVYLMIVDVGSKPAGIIATGMYDDTLVKTKDGWRFTKRTTKMDAMPAAAAVVPPK